MIFRKILYLSPGKLLEILDFDEKSSKSDAKNPNYTPRTRQKSTKNVVRSGQIDENLRKVEKITNLHPGNPKDTPTTRQNTLEN